MPFRRSAPIAFAALCAATVIAITPATATATRLPGEIDLRCATASLHRSADWYLPEGMPRGLVWLQHGFARTNANVASLAETLSNAGYLVFAPSLPFVDLAGCTLQNLGDNTRFLDNVAELFTTAVDPIGALARSLATAAAAAGRDAPPLPRQLVFIGHSAGAEAVEYVAHRLRTAHPDTWRDLRGLVLLDPVKSFLGNNTDTALTDLDPTGLPILTVSGPPGLCNNFAGGTNTLQTLLHRPFVGVRLPSGVHTDAEGPSSDAVGELACGFPRSANVAALQQLTVSWTDAFISGSEATASDPAATAAGAQPLSGA
ncbi:alpha/beta fold hydrolase [Nocardia aurantiaca]|uniref:Alpha/beta hydrolase n=1 Tax=Nocardia aurantiaca TaxID=2675850 RepID=A0A6I3L3L7_9NOCA|nr:alpha/beta hydrolase [Nocardia aurantiaca]MTE15234.1 alpha/beta hydrolase [Nocardia aurantiaca]